jgi:hypothetical protein
MKKFYTTLGFLLLLASFLGIPSGRAQESVKKVYIHKVKNGKVTDTAYTVSEPVHLQAEGNFTDHQVIISHKGGKTTTHCDEKGMDSLMEVTVIVNDDSMEEKTAFIHCDSSGMRHKQVIIVGKSDIGEHSAGEHVIVEKVIIKDGDTTITREVGPGMVDIRGSGKHMVWQNEKIDPKHRNQDIEEIITDKGDTVIMHIIGGGDPDMPMDMREFQSDNFSPEGLGSDKQVYVYHNENGSGKKVIVKKVDGNVKGPDTEKQVQVFVGDDNSFDMPVGPRMDWEAADHFSVFQPFGTRKIVLDLSFVDKEDTRMVVANNAGKVIWKEKVKALQGRYLREVTLDNSGPGTYTVSITRGKSIVDKTVEIR